MNVVATALFSLFALYFVAGVIVGLLFVIFGVTRALAQPTPVSAGGRVLLLPGSILLWPIVLGRWLQARSRR